MRIEVTDRVSHGILRRLRPPSARSMYLAHPYSREGRVNLGWTLRLQAVESAIASGKGVVIAVRHKLADWQYSASSEHRSQFSYEVIIDHGGEVATSVGGLSSVVVAHGDSVARGQALGQPLTNEVFFGVNYLGKFYDPASINFTFAVQNELEVVGQGRHVRYAPDQTVRDLSGKIAMYFVSMVSYFADSLCRTPQLLINVDFNGDGSKTGLAANGYTVTDYWNVYEPLTYTDTYTSYCY